MSLDVQMFSKKIAQNCQPSGMSKNFDALCWKGSINFLSLLTIQIQRFAAIQYSYSKKLRHTRKLSYQSYSSMHIHLSRKFHHAMLQF